MAFAITPFNPIVAYGITFEHTISIEETEGLQVVRFDNTSNVIAVGSPIFVRSADETILQYRGVASVSNDFGLVVPVPLQDALGASATVWTPTNFVVFTGEQRGSQRPEDDDGATTFSTHGGEWFGYQFKDPTDKISLSFLVRNSTAYKEWKTFRTVSRRSLTLSFMLAYYDVAERIGKTVKVKGMAGEHGLTRNPNWLVTGFSQVFGIEAEPPTTGIYVES